MSSALAVKPRHEAQALGMRAMLLVLEITVVTVTVTVTVTMTVIATVIGRSSWSSIIFAFTML